MELILHNPRVLIWVVLVQNLKIWTTSLSFQCILKKFQIWGILYKKKYLEYLILVPAYLNISIYKKTYWHDTLSKY